MTRNLAVELDRGAYRLNADRLLTPALAIYPEIVRHNIDCMITLLGDEPSRWRPHVKTVKLASMMQLLVDAGVTSAKCSTTLELLTACQAGMRDVLIAFPHTGANARRVAAIASEFPTVRVSALIESREQIRDWVDTPVDLFIDINSGMDRTGIESGCLEEIADLASRIGAAGPVFRGVHFYDGHATETDLDNRKELAHARYDQLGKIIAAIESRGIEVKEVISSGTPALPCALSYQRFWNGPFAWQVSPGTIVYNDASSLTQLPEEYGFRPAVLVISRVVSHPRPGVVTCDAGHKSLSVDSGVPNCVVLGEPDLRGLKPSEEHLPFEAPEPSRVPSLGSVLYLLPRHVCPTVNNFDLAAMVAEGEIVSIERVTARGREGPLYSAKAAVES